MSPLLSLDKPRLSYNQENTEKNKKVIYTKKNEKKNEQSKDKKKNTYTVTNIYPTFADEKEKEKTHERISDVLYEIFTKYEPVFN